jgi:hypothetical protein
MGNWRRRRIALGTHLGLQEAFRGEVLVWMDLTVGLRVLQKERSGIGANRLFRCS